MKFHYILFLFAFSSCINLTHVTNFSTTAESGIRKFEDIGYSYKLHCNDACKLRFLIQPVIKREDSCDCKLYEQTDSVTLLLQNVLRAYFHGLSSLSSYGKEKYDFDALTKALTENKFGNVEIKKAEAEAYTNISNILLRAGTDAWRKKKTSRYVQEANEPVKVLLSKLVFILDNLRIEINAAKSTLYNQYSEINGDTALSLMQKRASAADYYQQLGALKNVQGQLSVYMSLLKEISSAHQKLFDNRNKLTRKEIKLLLSQYAADYKSIIAELNKLEKE